MNDWNPTLMLVIFIIRCWDFSLDFTERVTYVVQSEGATGAMANIICQAHDERQKSFLWCGPPNENKSQEINTRQWMMRNNAGWNMLMEVSKYVLGWNLQMERWKWTWAQTFMPLVDKHTQTSATNTHVFHWPWIRFASGWDVAQLARRDGPSGHSLPS